jgi:fumarylacetoacetate (FAA) hydrolase
MQLATIKTEARDGELALVSSDHRSMVASPAGLSTLQSALDDWPATERLLQPLLQRLDDGSTSGVQLDSALLHAPLPRAYQWAEASTYHVHMERLRRARGIELPPDHGREPASYNSGSDSFLAPLDPIVLADETWGLDLEATVAVITDDVPMGTTIEEAPPHIKLVVLVNDLTHRNILPREYARGVGFFQAKPTRSVAPIAVSPGALADAWDGSLLHATILCQINGERLGALDTALDTAFDFAQIIAHMSQTRPLAAGSMIGSGTVSNLDPANGFGALAEKHAAEQIKYGGTPSKPLLHRGDRVTIEAFAPNGRSLFGAIDQLVVAPEDAAAGSSPR